MFPKLSLSFRSKIFLVLALVVFISIVTVLLVFQEATKNPIRQNIKSRFESTIYAFRQLQEFRTQFALDEISSVTMSNAQFRTILSTASVGTEDFGFGLASDHNEMLKDANLRLNSLLPFISIYQKSDVFIVTNSAGELLLSKADPEKFGQNLSTLAIFRRVFEEGQAVGILNSRLTRQIDVKIFPPDEQALIYQVVGKPVMFGQAVHGVVLWGRHIDRKLLESIKEISSVDIVLYSKDGINASTLPPEKEKDILKLINSNTIRRESSDSVDEVSIGDERFMARRASILPGENIEESGFIVLKSLTKELGFLRKIRLILLGVGALILLIAIALSFPLSGGVTRPVRALASAARKIGEGELDTKVDIRTGDELEQLGSAFNDMVDGLKEREFIKSTFERYVSKAVASEIIKNPDLVRLGGTRKELTVMFSDIGGFTGLSESLAPEEIVKHLNEYFEGMSSAILEFNGTINQFQGDAIIAFWGAPVPQENHAPLACHAALRCREFLNALQEKWMAQGIPGRTFRFGINTGEMVVGNIGSSSRFEYTVIGDEVNLASRLEGANKIYGTQILISENTYQLAKEEIAARELDIIRVVGKTQPVKIYELISEKREVDDQNKTAMEKFRMAINYYREGRWNEAIECFEKTLELNPKDRASQEYIRRCDEYRDSPPSKDWEGVFELRSK